MTKAIQTTCPYCGVGCGVLVNKNFPFTVSGDDRHPANIGRLCLKGSTLGETIGLNGRLLYPSVEGARVDWNTALSTVAQKFKDIISEFGPDAIAFYVSGQLLTEEYYVANKLMKGFIGSGNIDTNSRLCMASAVAAQIRAFGEDIVPGNYMDLEQADLVVFVGSNFAWCHPVLFERIKQSKKKVIVIDPRRTATCDNAMLHLQLKPKTDILLFNALLNYLRCEDHLDWEFLENHTEGFSSVMKGIKDASSSIPKVALACGLPEKDISTFFREFAKTEKVVTIFSQGVNQSSHGTDCANSIINCHLATGKIGKPGACPFSITGQPNAMGGREVGGLATQLAAHMTFCDEDVNKLKRFWGSENVTTKPGLKAVDLFSALEDDTIKAVWIMATNPAVSLPDSNKINETLRKKFVVVSECSEKTDTTSYANILLPATTWGEKNGTVTNSERCISRQRAFMEEPGEAKSDWWIICEVAKRMGFEKDFSYASAREIFIEHARLSGYENEGTRGFDISGLGNLSETEYEELQPIQWPIPINNPDGTARMFADGKFFTASGKARFILPESTTPANETSNEYPLILNTGRIRDQWHTMTRTGKVPKLTLHTPEPIVEIHPEDAKTYNIQNNDLVEIRSKWGSAIIKAVITVHQRRGTIFAPFLWNKQFSSDGRINEAVNPNVDPLSGQPEFKHTPVQIALHHSYWRGVIISRDEINIPNGTRFWVKALNTQCWRYEFAGESDVNEILTELQNNILGEWIEYVDKKRNVFRYACFKDNKIQLCAFFSPTLNQFSYNWITDLFLKDNIDDITRQVLLMGHPANNKDNLGRTVCMCFNVGEIAILNAIKTHKLKTVEEIGYTLKAGTNCGSCTSEIRSIIDNSTIRADHSIDITKTS